MRNREAWERVVTETVATALGQEHRSDPVLPGTGGPAGNAQLTAWTGLFLLVVFLAELVTLLDVSGLISWHLALGVLLIPPALLKTATTGWRILRYYTGHPAYRSAGPPPTVLRVLGPLVVLSTLGLLGTGVALVLVGATASRQTLFTVLGQRVDVLTFHQGAFIVWAVATGLHVLARTAPAWQIVRGTPAPGPARRSTALVATLGLAVACVGWVLVQPGGWTEQPSFHPEDDAMVISAPLPSLTVAPAVSGGPGRCRPRSSAARTPGTCERPGGRARSPDALAASGSAASHRARGRSVWSRGTGTR